MKGLSGIRTPLQGLMNDEPHFPGRCPGRVLIGPVGASAPLPRMNDELCLPWAGADLPHWGFSSAAALEQERQS